MEQTNTQTVSIAASPTHVFEFIADPETLRLWAVGFCRRIRREGATWIVTTAQGDMPIRYETDRGRGTIDFYFSPAPGVEIAAFSRVVPNGNGAEYVFTQFQAPGMPDAAFAAQVSALTEELRVLSSVIRARAVCPA
ncbi:MAG: SRPBCC family protein [Acidobacteria bacterium]|nr:SRPBCC family protein [Acidobacteriota bacterium]